MTLLVLGLVACGGGNVTNGDGDGGGNNGDGNTSTDGTPPIGPCDPGPTQCTNCIDDDDDGFIDGFDPECISNLDNREDSFATGIPGDNMDLCNQDCFFDGNSGAGNDGCNLHICCLLGGCDVPTVQSCANQFDPAECNVSQECIDNCQPITPPGCDCFGCCTVCNGAGCFDVITNPLVAPNCDQDVVDDPDLCPPCMKTDQCEPPAECAPDQTECAGDAECGPTEFCARGCCIPNIG